VQCLLRYAMAKVISGGILNSLIVTNSPEANLEFLGMHSHLFARTFPSHPLKHRKRSPDTSSPPTVIYLRGCHTFSSAVDLTPEMMRLIFEENMRSLAALLPESLRTYSGRAGCSRARSSFRACCTWQARISIRMRTTARPFPSSEAS
jgi:hypothetical protein